MAGSQSNVNDSRALLTCALGSLDVGELGATGFDRGPVEAAPLMIGDVASQRIRAFHERRWFAITCRYTADTQRQRQNSQSDVLEERSHVNAGILDSHLRIYEENYPSTLQVPKEPQNFVCHTVSWRRLGASRWYSRVNP